MHLQIQLRNSSAQFVIDLSRELNLSFSFCVLAVHTTHLFFHQRSYLEFNRFEIGAGALALACKLIDFHIDFRTVASKFYKLYCEKVIFWDLRMCGCSVWGIILDVNN